jgi:hypothetical protein
MVGMESREKKRWETKDAVSAMIQTCEDTECNEIQWDGKTLSLLRLKKEKKSQCIYNGVYSWFVKNTVL